MTFHVGQEVTLKGPFNTRLEWVADDGEPENGLPKPQFGDVCRILNTNISQRTGTLFLYLDGFCGSFDASEFRPVVKPTTDISIFTRMLDGTRSPELVT